jgi:hypothetical protein
VCHITPENKHIHHALTYYTTVSSNTTKQRQQLSLTLWYVQHHKKIECQIHHTRKTPVFSSVTELVNIIMLQHERKHRFYSVKGHWACGACGGGERCAQGFGGEAGGNETIGETQA